MTATAPTSRVITGLVFTRLQTLTTVNWYRGEVPDHPPMLLDASNQPSDRVAPYGVLYPFPGKPGDPGQRDLANAGRDIDWGGQVTLAGGFCEDVEAAVDATRELLYGWQPTIAGVALGTLLPPTGFDPGPVRINRSIVPPRFQLDLQYRLTATAN